MRLSVVSTISSYEHHKVEDTSSSRVEAGLPALVARLEEAALRRKVQAEIWAERARERERLSRDWQTRKEAKDKLLHRLGNLEEMAKNLDRAESLRRLKAKLEASAGLRSDIFEVLELLTKLADWLDPLTHTPWLGIDDVADRNPYSVYP
jgi:DNA repair ATPase RecN